MAYQQTLVTCFLQDPVCFIFGSLQIKKGGIGINYAVEQIHNLFVSVPDAIEVGEAPGLQKRRARFGHTQVEIDILHGRLRTIARKTQGLSGFSTNVIYPPIAAILINANEGAFLINHLDFRKTHILELSYLILFSRVMS